MALLGALVVAPLLVALLALAGLLALLALLTLLPALALLAALPLLLLLATLPLALAQELVLAPRQPVELVHHLAALLVALPLLALARLPALAVLGHHRRGVLHHLAQLFEQPLGLLALAVASHLADLVEHLLDVVGGDGVVGIHAVRLLLHAAALLGILHPLGQFLLPVVHRVVELLDQPLDLLVAGLALHGIAQVLARLLDGALGVGGGALLEPQRHVPQQLLGVGDHRLLATGGEPSRADAQAELHHRIVAVRLRTRA